MDLAGLFSELPLVKLMGIEVTEVADGLAMGHLPYREELLSNPDGDVIHGGATYTLADTVGGAAVTSLSESVSPTVDFRMDYLAPATTDLTCEAEVIRGGGSLALVEVEVHDAEGAHVATGTGAYKTTGQGEETPWAPETSVGDAER